MFVCFLPFVCLINMGDNEFLVGGGVSNRTVLFKAELTVALKRQVGFQTMADGRSKSF